MKRETPLSRYVPILNWLPNYRREDLSGDLTAGAIVAVMLVPQGMAYAMLAGLPPYMGLYASVLPIILYALFGSSRALAVGPVAIVSLMVATSLAEFSAAGVVAPVAGAILLAAISGVMLLAMGILRLGFLVNFLSHPVISGFTSAAALVIAVSQLKHLLGLDFPRQAEFYGTVAAIVESLPGTKPATLAVSVISLLILFLSRGPLDAFLKKRGVSAAWRGPLTKLGPLIVVLAGTLAVALLRLDGAAGVAIVGQIPAGLPPLAMPQMDFSVIAALAPTALLISTIGFLESVSVAKALASKRRQSIEPNQELIGLGAANLGAAFSGAYPVAGGFGRSSVNFTSGANTPLASLITAVLMAITLLVLTPLFHFLPRAVLAAIILMAVMGLFDWKTLADSWRYNKADAAALAATFATVLAAGAEVGIAVGAALSLALHLYRSSKPHIAIVGRVDETEHYRNVERHVVRTDPSILAVRIDESLYFANTRYLEDHILAEVAARPEIKHLVLICSAVNEIDTSALESLESLIARLRDMGVTMHLAEVKGPVTDRLLRTSFFEHLAPGRIFLSTHQAMTMLGAQFAEKSTPVKSSGPAS